MDLNQDMDDFYREQDLIAAGKMCRDHRKHLPCEFCDTEAQLAEAKAEIERLRAVIRRDNGIILSATCRKCGYQANGNLKLAETSLEGTIVFK